jgi:copper chaperone CopZ
MWRAAVALGLMLVAATAGAAQYRLQVDGLACPFCAYGVEKKLAAVKGVEKVDVDIKSGTVLVTVADSAAFGEATARAAVKDAGFTLRGFEKVPGAGAAK